VKIVTLEDEISAGEGINIERRQSKIRKMDQERMIFAVTI